MNTKNRYASLRLPGVMPKLDYAGRRFYAWWEGYGFDPGLERRAVLLQPGSAKSLSTMTDRADYVSEVVWGPGRLMPGSATWSMQLARSLMIDARAKVVLFGAERGGMLQDLGKGTRWSVTGYAKRTTLSRAGNLQNYAKVRRRLGKPTFDGALMLFELHHEAEPTQLLRLMAEKMKPGSKGLVVDFTSLRKNVRLKSAFAAPWQGSLRQAVDYENVLDGVGLTVTSTVDETKSYIPLVARGWAGWRYAWQILSDVGDNRQRATLLRLMGEYAALWAERHDAMQSGQLQVTRFMVEKSH